MSNMESQDVNSASSSSSQNTNSSAVDKNAMSWNRGSVVNVSSSNGLNSGNSTLAAIHLQAPIGL